MKILNFTSKEKRALEQLLTYGMRICSSGCVYSEMSRSKKDCPECEFTKAIDSMSEKVGLQ